LTKVRTFLHGLWTSRTRGGRVRIAVALVLVLSATALFWASRDYAVVAPDWDGQVRGVAYTPSHMYTKEALKHVSPEQIDRDMRQLSAVTGHIRTYTVDGGMDKVPEIARRYGMTVTLGLYLTADLEQNEKEIELGLKTALANRRTIDRVVVGNETQTFGMISVEQLNAYILRVRHALPASRSPPPSLSQPGCWCQKRRKMSI